VAGEIITSTSDPHVDQLIRVTAARQTPRRLRARRREAAGASPSTSRLSTAVRPHQGRTSSLRRGRSTLTHPHVRGPGTYRRQAALRLPHRCQEISRVPNQHRSAAGRCQPRLDSKPLDPGPGWRTTTTVPSCAASDTPGQRSRAVSGSPGRRPNSAACVFPSVATAEATARNRKHGWPNWLGGLTLLLVVNVPTYVLLSRAAGNIPYRTGLLLAALLVLLHLALQALIAPLVSYRRRDAFTIFIPFVGWVITWILGARLAELSKRDWAQPDQRHNRRWKTASHPR
jgi:hypothetical protein